MTYSPSSVRDFTDHELGNGGSESRVQNSNLGFIT